MSKIETTINISIKNLESIMFASSVTGETRSEIIVRLLKQVMKKESLEGSICRRIKYQKSEVGESWRRSHVRFKGDEYEFFLDLRKILKMSLSHIIANAIKKYLNHLINGKNTDNYLFNNYVIAKEDADGVIFWKLFWGIPKNPEKFLTL